MNLDRSPDRSKRLKPNRACAFDRLEPRMLLSAATHHPVKHAAKSRAKAPRLIAAPIFAPGSAAQHPIHFIPIAAKSGAGTTQNASPLGLGFSTPYAATTPAQMVGTYLGTSFNFFGVTGDGTGQTIAIVDAYDAPTLLNSTDPNFATSDLAVFDAQFHLPNPPSFTKYGVSGGRTSPTLPGTDPAGPYYSSSIVTWEAEEALDVEWAHVMAPKAKIALIEAVNSGFGNLFQGVVAANYLPGVNVVSMSFGGNESGLNEPLFNTDLNSNGAITFLASSGDTGAYGSTGVVAPQYPAASPYVVSVGGTSLAVSGTSWSSETTWGNNTSSGTSGGGGGGISANTAQPGYQSGIPGGGGNRQYPDVSLDGNNNTGVAIYDTYDFGVGTGWVPGKIGGTSLATPVMAGLVAVADQGRALVGKPTFNSNGLAGGTDIHNLLYSLAGSSNTYAADFHDITTGNAIGPAPQYSAATGYDLASGLGSPVANYLVSDLAGISSAATVSQPVISSLYFKPDAVSTLTDVWVNSATPGTGTPTYQYANAYIGSYTDTGGSLSFTVIGPVINVSGSSATLTATSAAGAGNAFVLGSSNLSFGTTIINFVNVSTVNINPGGSTSTLMVNGNITGNDLFTVTSNSVTFNALAVNYINLASLSLNPGTGTDVLVVNSGSVSVAAQSAGLGILQRNFSSMSIASGASAMFATAPLHSDRQLVQTTSLSVLGRLDLGGNDLIVHNGNLTAINALLSSGSANGQWNGGGITSAAAHSDTNFLTALGVMQNTLYGAGGQPAFDGVSPATSDILVKYTYYGDANLDGKVDGTDYSRIDGNYLGSATGWFNGDFNYDAQLNGSDYTLIDNTFNTQRAQL